MPFGLQDPGYPHWMLREIHEQPATLRATLEHYVDEEGFRGETCGAVLEWVKRIATKILIVASGSSRHAGLFAAIVIKDLSGIPVDVEFASEYSYQPEEAMERAAVVVISQSGETADTLSGLRKANAGGLETLALTNVEDSTMEREALVRFPTVTGVERSIPATKSFTAQLLNLYLLGLMSAVTRGRMDERELGVRLTELRAMPASLAAQLGGWDATAHAIAELNRSATNFLFLGRGVHYPIALEGALKLKEAAYLHADGYPSGELKHGPNALVGEGTPLVMIATVNRADPNSVQRYEMVLRLMREMREQGACVIAVANAGDAVVRELATHVMGVDETREELMAMSEVIALQLFSYWVAVNHGVDVDHPRNLTKAVLVE